MLGIANCFFEHSKDRAYDLQQPQSSRSTIARAESLNTGSLSVIATIDEGSSRHEEDERKAPQTYHNVFVETRNLQENLGKICTSSLAIMKELRLISISLQSKFANILIAILTDEPNTITGSMYTQRHYI